jgi:hypothetical protein
MFNSVFHRLDHLSPWRHAPFDISELPQPAACADETTRRLLLVAGGLALVLSRCNPKEVERQYPSAYELYRLLRSELKRHGKTSETADLLLDTMHEVSERLDPVSRHALRASLEVRRVEDRDHQQKIMATTGSLSKAAMAVVNEVSNSRLTFTSASIEVTESDEDSQDTLPATFTPLVN